MGATPASATTIIITMTTAMMVTITTIMITSNEINFPYSGS